MLEYLPSTTRATLSIAIELSWSIGSIFEYLTAMIIVPTYGWRVLTALSALPISIVVVCMYVSMTFSKENFVAMLSCSLYLNHHDILLPVVVQRRLNIF